MKMTLMPLLLAVGLGVSVSPTAARAETPREEKMAHPRIAKAIDNLEDAISYLESTPDDFGGHKTEALRASREAVRQLRFALQYKAAVDTRKGR
jgi:hypothetical protein